MACAQTACLPGLARFTSARVSVLVLATLAGLFLLVMPGGVWAQPKFPPLTGRVVDEAGLLSPADREDLTRQFADLEAKSTDQLVVVTLLSLQGYEIADYGYRLGRAWGIGQGERKDNGVLLIVVPSARKVRIEVGRGLEPVLTDATSRLIIENRILPAFRRGDFRAGILAGAKDIQDVLLGNAEEVRARAKGARRPANAQPVDWFGIAVFAAFGGLFLYNFWRASRAAQRLPQGQRRRSRRQRTRDDGFWTVGPGSGGWGSGSGGWSGGGSSGGGFSGGGGSFGGGGASGDW